MIFPNQLAPMSKHFSRSEQLLPKSPGQQVNSTKEHSKFQYMSQKQGKQLFLESQPLKVFLKKLYNSQFLIQFPDTQTHGSTNFASQIFIASSFLVYIYYSSSNQTGQHFQTQGTTLPQISQNSQLLYIFSHLLKILDLLFLNFQSKTNLYPKNNQHARIILIKEQSMPYIQLCQLISLSIFRIYFLILLFSASYFDFLTDSCPKRYLQNYSSIGNKVFLSQIRRQLILAHEKMSGQRMGRSSVYQLASLDLTVLVKLSVTAYPIIQYSLKSSPWCVRKMKGLDQVSVTSSREQGSFENLIRVAIFLAFMSTIWQ